MIINANGAEISVLLSSEQQNDYISLTDIAKYKNPDEPRIVISNWLSSYSTIDFLAACVATPIRVGRRRRLSFYRTWPSATPNLTKKCVSPHRKQRFCFRPTYLFRAHPCAQSSKCAKAQNARKSLSIF